MKTERRKEGFIEIDHRLSPGLNDNEMSFTAPDLEPGSGRGHFKTTWVCCAHCQQAVMQNPKRTRQRAYCRKCDHYLCDQCAIVEAVGSVEHVPFQRVIDDVLALASRGLPIPVFQRGKWSPIGALYG